MNSQNPFTRVLSNSLFFSIGTVVGRLVNVAMLPIYTTYLTSNEYGIVNTLTGFSALMCVITMMSLRAALMRFDCDIKTEQKPIFVSSVISVIIINSIIVVGTLWTCRNNILAPLFGGIAFYPLIFYTLLVVFFNTIFTTYQTILQSKQEGKKYTESNIIYMFVHAFLNVLFIMLLRWGSEGYMLSLLLSNVILAIFGMLALYHSGVLTNCISWNYIKKSIAYSVPIIPHDLSNNLSEYVSKILLNKFLSYAATGVFSIAAQCSGMMSLVQTSLNMAFHPWFNEQMKRGNAGRKNIETFSVFIFGTYCYFCIILSFFSKEALFLLATSDYHSAWRLIPILSIGLVIRFIYYTHTLSILYNIRASKFISICSLSGCAFNFGISYFFIKYFSLSGAAIASIAYVIFQTIITVFYSNYVCKVDFGMKRMIVILCETMVLLFAGLFFDYIGTDSKIILLNVIFKTAIVCCITLILFIKYKKRVEEIYYALKERTAN